MLLSIRHSNNFCIFLKEDRIKLDQMLYFSFITDPYFGYKLLVSIITGVALCVAAGWGVYIWLGKNTKLTVLCRLLLAIAGVVAIGCLLGLIAEWFD